MATRHMAAAEHNALATAWRRLVLRVGKASALAAHLGVPESRVSEWGDPDQERSPPVAVVMEAEAFAGEPIVSAALAAARGYRLVPIEGAPAPALAPLAASVMREMGEAFTTFSAAAADGEFSPRELAAIAREFADLARAADALAAAARGAAA